MIAPCGVVDVCMPEQKTKFVIHWSCWHYLQLIADSSRTVSSQKTCEALTNLPEP